MDRSDADLRRTSMSAKTVGHIGLGGIGRPMAERLLERGFGLIACDKRQDILDEFRSKGVQATSVAADCMAADVVIVVVGTDEQVKSVALGPDGLLSRADPAKPRTVI